MKTTIILSLAGSSLASMSCFFWFPWNSFTHTPQCLSVTPSTPCTASTRVPATCPACQVKATATVTALVPASQSPLAVYLAASQEVSQNPLAELPAVSLAASLCQLADSLAACQAAVVLRSRRLLPWITSSLLLWHLSSTSRRDRVETCPTSRS
jgi:hypothetical protein